MDVHDGIHGTDINWFEHVGTSLAGISNWLHRERDTLECGPDRSNYGKIKQEFDHSYKATPTA